MATFRIFLILISHALITQFSSAQTQTAPYPAPQLSNEQAQARLDWDKEQANKQNCATAEAAYAKIFADLKKSGCGNETSCVELAEECDAAIDEDYSGPASVVGGANDSGHRAKVARFKSCPIFTEEELKEIRDRKDEFKEKMEDAEEEMTKLAADADKAKGRIENSQQEIKDTMAELQEKIGQAIGDRQEELKGKIQDNVAQMSQKLMDVQALQNNYMDEIQLVYNQCQARALQQIAAIKEERKKKIDANRLSVQSLNDLTALTSSRDRLKKMAMEFYAECRKDPQTKAALESLTRKNTLMMKIIERDVAALKSASDDLIKKMSDATQDRELQNTLKELGREAKSKVSAAEKEIRNDQLEYQGLQAQIQTLDRKRSEAELRYNQYLEQESAATATGKEGGSMSKDEFVGTVSELKSAASAAYNICNCASDIPVTETGTLEKKYGSNCAKYENKDVCDTCTSREASLLGPPPGVAKPPVVAGKAVPMQQQKGYYPEKVAPAAKPRKWIGPPDDSPIPGGK